MTEFAMFAFAVMLLAALTFIGILLWQIDQNVQEIKRKQEEGVVMDVRRTHERLAKED